MGLFVTTKVKISCSCYCLWTAKLQRLLDDGMTLEWILLHYWLVTPGSAAAAVKGTFYDIGWLMSLCRHVGYVTSGSGTDRVTSLVTRL